MLKVKVATTDEERLAAYRVRYDVFFLEQGDERYAVHDSGVFVDENDQKQTHLLIAFDDCGHVAGTVRVTVRRETAFLRDDLYPYEKLAELTGCTMEEVKTSSVLIDRGAILPQWRGKGVLFDLLREMERIALDASCRFAWGVTRADNLQVQRCLALLGWSRFDSHSKGGWEAIIWQKHLSPAPIQLESNPKC